MKDTPSNPIRHFPVGLLAVFCLLMPLSVHAEGFELQQFNPMPDQSGNLFSTSSADVPAHLDWSAMFMFNYGHNPLVWQDDDGERLGNIVGQQATGHLLMSVGVIERFSLELDLPVVMMQQGSAVDGVGIAPDQGGFGLGDLRFVPKAQVFSTRAYRGDDGLGLALLADLHLPTGDSDFLQGGDFRIGPRLAFDAVVRGARIALNLGYLYRPANEVGNLDIRDTLGWKVGAEMPVSDKLRITAEVFGRLTPGAEEIRRAESPAEALAGGKFQHDNLFVTAGAGMGLVNGYGTPDVRAFAGLGWAPVPQLVEPVEPTLEPEPEPTCQASSVAADCGDAPPSVCEDGVLEIFARDCDDGTCVFPSRKNPCPDTTECGEFNGEGACVPLPIDDPNLVEVDEEGERINIAEVVHFGVNSDEIDERSYGLLDQVAQVLRENPQIGLVRIEGHSDDQGDRDYNVELSERRAESVRLYLINKYVEGERLVARGVGPEQPIADNATEEGRRTNRRVEFHIEERD